MESSILAWLVATRSSEGDFTDEHYRSILADRLHPLLQTVFPGELPLVQDEHNDELEHLTWYAQSPNPNIIEPL